MPRSGNDFGFANVHIIIDILGIMRRIISCKYVNQLHFFCVLFGLASYVEHFSLQLKYSCLAGARHPHHFLDPLVCLMSEMSYSLIFGSAIGLAYVGRLETVCGT